MPQQNLDDIMSYLDNSNDYISYSLTMLNL